MASKRKRKPSVRLSDQNFTYDFTGLKDNGFGFDNNNYVDNLEMLQDMKYSSKLVKQSCDIKNLKVEEKTDNLNKVDDILKNPKNEKVDSIHCIIKDKHIYNTSPEPNISNKSNENNHASHINSNNHTTVPPLIEICHLDFNDNDEDEKDEEEGNSFEENENPAKRQKTIDDNSRKRRPRTVFNEMQSEYLNAVFECKEVLNWNEREKVAKLLKLSDFNVKTWFKNGRRVSRKDSNWAIGHIQMARSFRNKFEVLPDFSVVCNLCDSYIDDYELLEKHWMGRCRQNTVSKHISGNLNKKSSSAMNSNKLKQMEEELSLKKVSSVSSSDLSIQEGNEEAKVCDTFDQQAVLKSRLDNDLIIPPIIHVPKVPYFPANPGMNMLPFVGQPYMFPGFHPQVMNGNIVGLPFVPDLNSAMFNNNNQNKEPISNSKKKNRRKSFPKKTLRISDGEEPDTEEESMPCFPQPIQIIPDYEMFDKTQAAETSDIIVEKSESTVVSENNVSKTYIWHIPIDVSSDESINESMMDDEQRLIISKLTGTDLESKESVNTEKIMNHTDENQKVSSQSVASGQFQKQNSGAVKKISGLVNKGDDFGFTSSCFSQKDIKRSESSESNIEYPDSSLIQIQQPWGNKKIKKRYRVTFTDMQSSILSALFDVSQWLAVPEIEWLANLLQLSYSNVKVWFKNTRRLNLTQNFSKRFKMAALFYEKFDLFPDLSIKCKVCQNFIMENHILQQHWNFPCTKASVMNNPAPVMNIARTILGKKGPPHHMKPLKDARGINIMPRNQSNPANYQMPFGYPLMPTGNVSNFNMVDSTTKIIEIKPVEIDVLPGNNIAKFDHVIAPITIIPSDDESSKSDCTNEIHASYLTENNEGAVSNQEPLDFSTKLSPNNDNASIKSETISTSDEENNKSLFVNTKSLFKSTNTFKYNQKKDKVIDSKNSSLSSAMATIASSEETNDVNRLQIVNTFSVFQQTGVEQLWMNQTMQDPFPQLKTKSGKIMRRKPATPKKPHYLATNVSFKKVRRNRTAFPKIKTAVLSAVFQKNNYPVYANILQVASALDLTYDTIKLWFKNMRQLQRCDPKGVERRSQMAVSALENVVVYDDLGIQCKKCGDKITSYSVLEHHWLGSCN